MGITNIVNNIVKSITNINKSDTRAIVRPSLNQPYMSTETGAKLPIFPFPLSMIYELADNNDALRIHIETINREILTLATCKPLLNIYDENQRSNNT